MTELPFCLGLALLTGCIGIGGPLATPPPRVITVRTCPPLQNWTKQFQSGLADELEKNRESLMAQVVVQSIRDRKIIRACRSPAR